MPLNTQLYTKVNTRNILVMSILNILYETLCNYRFFTKRIRMLSKAQGVSINDCIAYLAREQGKYFYHTIEIQYHVSYNAIKYSIICIEVSILQINIPIILSHSEPLWWEKLQIGPFQVILSHFGGKRLEKL